jgi:transcriptional regulator with XRE-family HTH domain
LPRCRACRLPTPTACNEKLAERADLHWTYLGQIERGERTLGLVNILRLAGALKVDAGELVKGLRA